MYKPNMFNISDTDAEWKQFHLLHNNVYEKVEGK